MPIVGKLDERVRAAYDEPFVQIVDEWDNVHMVPPTRVER